MTGASREADFRSQRVTCGIRQGEKQIRAKEEQPGTPLEGLCQYHRRHKVIETMQNLAGSSWGKARMFAKYRPKKAQKEIEQVSLTEGRQIKESQVATGRTEIPGGGERGERAGEKGDGHVGIDGQR